MTGTLIDIIILFFLGVFLTFETMSNDVRDASESHVINLRNGRLQKVSSIMRLVT
jgi:hypothetical protein